MTSSLDQIRKEVVEKIWSEFGQVKIKIEGPTIVIFTDNPELVIKNTKYAADLAKTIKRRVTIRLDPSLRKEEDVAKEKILEIIPREAEVERIIFDHNSGEAIVIARKIHFIQASYEQLALEVIKNTGWKLVVEKKTIPDTKSFLQVLNVLTLPSEDRKNFLMKTGDRIFRPRVVNLNTAFISFLGGVEQVGRSSLLLSTEESKILIDAGINPGSSLRSTFFPRFDYEIKDINELEAVIITHAHLDHVGALPFLIKYGYKGPIYMTEPTLYLSALLLEDLYNVDLKSGRTPFFELRDIKEIVEQTIILKYGQTTDIAPNVRVTLHNSGHILGSAMVHLSIGENEGNVLYTSDFKLGKSLLLNSAVYKKQKLNALIMECTYGGENDLMPPRSEMENTLIRIVNETLKAGGKVLIPTLAVGRAQEVILILLKAIENKMIEEVPIFIDGMIMEVTKIHSAFPRYLSSELSSLMVEEDENPFDSHYLVPVKNQDSREEILSQGKSIILSTSGMLEGGPVLEYFKRIAPDPNSSIVFVNYQIEGTLGQRVLSGLKEVQMADEDGKPTLVSVNSKVYRIDGLSGHSDRTQLLTFLRRMLTGQEMIYLVHGEISKLRSMHNYLNRFAAGRVVVPKLGDRHRVC